MSTPSDGLKADGAGAEFVEGYCDGRDPNAPEPSGNRSHAYRHSFAIGRREIERKPPVVASEARRQATIAALKDLDR